MANITPVSCTNAGVLTPEVATTPGGDTIVGITPSPLILAFRNGHASPITINIAPSQASAKVNGAGSVTIPTRSIVLAAAASATFEFRDDDRSAYLDASGNMPITYTGGNALLTLRAIQ